MNLRTPCRVLSLALLVFISTSLNGCLLVDAKRLEGIDGELNLGQWSKDSLAIKETRLNVSQTLTGIPEQVSSVRVSPKEIVLVGFPLEPGASRQQIQEAILRRGGKLLSRLHSPERDEFDSSRWIKGSEKTAAIYTQSGEFVGLAISWPMEDSQGGCAFVAQLQSKLIKDFGPTTRENIGQGGWPVFHRWETAPVNATIIGEGKASPTVLAMFVLPERLTALNNELINRGFAK